MGMGSIKWTVSNTSLSRLLTLTSPLLPAMALLNSSIWISTPNAMIASSYYLVNRHDSLEWQRATSNNEGVSQGMGSRNWCIPIFSLSKLKRKVWKTFYNFFRKHRQNWALGVHCGHQLDYICLYWLFLLVTLSPSPHSKFPLPAHKMLTQAVLLERTQAKW